MAMRNVGLFAIMYITVEIKFFIKLNYYYYNNNNYFII
jgi:hypothetical protein